MKFGEAFTTLRLKANFSIREFCRLYSLDIGNISKIERGVLPPPKPELLKTYLRYLGIKENSLEWQKMTLLSLKEFKPLTKKEIDQHVENGISPILKMANKGKPGYEKFIKTLKKGLSQAWTP